MRSARANPIGLRELVPSATLRQSNCYYSSSDAAFADRYQASAEYERVGLGAIALDGGWRVYSSGAGILFSLIVRHLFGLRLEADVLLIDPVLPPASTDCASRSSCAASASRSAIGCAARVAASMRCSSTAARWRSARSRTRIGAVPHESR
jgi:hypothetical protein